MASFTIKRILKREINPSSHYEFTTYKLNNGDEISSVNCECCNEPIFSNGDRYLNYIKNYENHAMCIIRNDLFEKIAKKVNKKDYTGASAGKGMFCYDCMCKKLGKEIDYDDLYFGDGKTGTSIPFANFSWIFKFFKEGKVSKSKIISDLKNCIKNKSGKVSEKIMNKYKKELEFYEKI